MRVFSSFRNENWASRFVSECIWNNSGGTWGNLITGCTNVSVDIIGRVKNNRPHMCKDKSWHGEMSWLEFNHKFMDIKPDIEDFLRIGNISK